VLTDADIGMKVFYRALESFAGRSDKRQCSLGIYGRTLQPGAGPPCCFPRHDGGFPIVSFLWKGWVTSDGPKGRLLRVHKLIVESAFWTSGIGRPFSI